VKKVIKHKLEFKSTLPYFKKHIGYKTLGEIIIEKTNFEQGFFFTFLPHDTIHDRMYQFNQGGIMPFFSTGKKAITSSGKVFIPNRIVTFDKGLAFFLLNFLKKKHSSKVIIEDTYAEPNSNFISINDVALYFYNREVFYVINEKTPLKSVYKVIRTSGDAWHFLAVITDASLQKAKKLLKNDIAEIVKDVRFIIAGAYDGEGFIFWEKTT
jgi:hypothetical protein